MKRVLATVTGLMMAVAATAAAMTTSPQVLVKEKSEQLLSAVEGKRRTLEDDPAKLRQLVEQIILPHVDFETMGQWVLGKYWRRAEERQRERFVEEFRQLLVRTYSKAVLEYSGEGIQYLPLRGSTDSGDVMVRTELDQKSGLPLTINYSLHLKDERWQVYDVEIDGVSLVQNYRNSFASEIREKGIDGLIDKLAARNRQALR